MLLESQVALITGGSSGIGRAAANIFASQGATVIIMDRSLEGKAVTNGINDNGIRSVIPHMKERKQGAIIATSSISGEYGQQTILYPMESVRQE
jgi:NAD(P)-dependent dehydrogenase (short-subunit alcohol dehydrogenase family)